MVPAAPAAPRHEVCVAAGPPPLASTSTHPHPGRAAAPAARRRCPPGAPGRTPAPALAGAWPAARCWRRGRSASAAAGGLRWEGSAGARRGGGCGHAAHTLLHRATQHRRLHRLGTPSTRCQVRQRTPPGHPPGSSSTSRTRAATICGRMLLSFCCKSGSSRSSRCSRSSMASSEMPSSSAALRCSGAWRRTTAAHRALARGVPNTVQFQTVRPPPAP